MSSAGAPDIRISADGVRVAIISGMWHTDILFPMEREAQQAVTGAGAQAQVFHVAGSFELPFAAQALVRRGFDAAVCLGVIIRGETPHFDYVSQAVTTGLTRVQLDEAKPVGFGVLTVDDYEQAFQRSGAEGSRESKGREAAEAALLSWHMRHNINT